MYIKNDHISIYRPYQLIIGYRLLVFSNIRGLCSNEKNCFEQNLGVKMDEERF